MYEKLKIMKTKHLGSINKANIFLQNLCHAIVITFITSLFSIEFQMFNFSKLLWGQSCNKT